MSDAILSINATIGKSAADEVEGLEAKVKASMRRVIREDWMASNDDLLLRAGVGGAMLSVGKDSPDYERLVHSVNGLRKATALMAALQAGLSVNLEKEVAKAEAEEAPLPLLKWFREIKEEHP